MRLFWQPRLRAPFAAALRSQGPDDDRERWVFNYPPDAKALELRRVRIAEIVQAVKDRLGGQAQPAEDEADLSALEQSSPDENGNIPENHFVAF